MAEWTKYGNNEITLNKLASLPDHYERDQVWALKTPYTTAANRYTLLSPNRMTVNINNSGYALLAQIEIALSVAANWDSIVTDYTVAANRAGKNFYIYACEQDGASPKILLSAASTYPAGYTASNSRKIGGFHCLCVAVGTISGHTLTGFVAGNVLPASIWDLKHRPVSNPGGMVYDSNLHKWVDIYLASGTGANTASVYGGTISDTRDWMSFVDDGLAVKKRLLSDHEFQSIAAGSNEETNITGSADPVTSGGHVDTAARRMISSIGCEDCCGAAWQWLRDQTYRYDGGSHTHTFTGSALATHAHTENQEASYTQSVQTEAKSAGTPTGSNASVDPVPVWAYYDLPGAKGSLFKQGTYGDAKLLAGGSWYRGTHCGSRSRNASGFRCSADADIGGRFASEPL